MDFGICFWVAGVGKNAAKEPPGFRSSLTPTPATLTQLTIIREPTPQRRNMDEGSFCHHVRGYRPENRCECPAETGINAFRLM